MAPTVRQYAGDGDFVGSGRVRAPSESEAVFREDRSHQLDDVGEILELVIRPTLLRGEIHLFVLHDLGKILAHRSKSLGKLSLRLILLITLAQSHQPLKHVDVGSVDDRSLKHRERRQIPWADIAHRNLRLFALVLRHRYPLRV